MSTPTKADPVAFNAANLWADFCDQLKDAGEAVLQAPAPEDALTQAEGIRYLTRLLRAALEGNVESSDPRFPRFYQLSNETIKIGNDNPDNTYHNANLDGTLEYRIVGNRGTVNYLSFATQAGSYATTGTMEPSGQLDGTNLITDEEGNFEIIVSSTQQPGNWLPMLPETVSMLVRQTFNDRGSETPATYRIECLNAVGDNILQPSKLVDQLQRSTDFIAGTSALFVEWMNNYSAHVNALPSDDQERCQRAGGDAAIHYLQSRWKLGADEALLLHARTIPNCETWNFQLSNYWMESLDYRHFKISINQHSAIYNADGSVTVVVAHQDPGPDVPNWLTTAGHGEGAMLWRWVEADSHPPVECRPVAFSQLTDEIAKLQATK